MFLPALMRDVACAMPLSNCDLFTASLSSTPSATFVIRPSSLKETPSLPSLPLIVMASLPSASRLPASDMPSLPSLAKVTEASLPSLPLTTTPENSGRSFITTSKPPWSL